MQKKNVLTEKPIGLTFQWEISIKSHLRSVNTIDKKLDVLLKQIQISTSVKTSI